MAERTRTTGWLSRQHGVWAMLVLPFAVGTALVWQAGGLQVHLVPLFATWVLGYCAFYAASGLLKSPSARRRRWLPALALYTLATLGSGLATVWLAGPGLWWWLAGYALPLCCALWLAARREERHLAGGLLTVTLAAAMVLVVRFPDPVGMLTDPAFPAAASWAILLFGYLGGTVFHVKAMIRKRGQLGWRNASIAWHALWTVVASAGAITGQVERWWPAFFLAATVRAWLLPMVSDQRRIRPGVVGSVEVVLSVAALGLALAGLSR